MKISFRILIAFVFFLPNLVEAQVLAIEKFKFESDSSNYWLGNCGLFASTKKQKNEIFLLEINTNTAYLSKLHDYTLVTDLDLSRVENQKLTNKGFLAFSTNLWRKRKLMPEGVLQGQFDIGRGLYKRYVASVGARYRLISTKVITSSFKSGLMFENETWKNDVDPTNVYYIENNLFKWTNNFSVRFTYEQVNLFLSLYFQALPEAIFFPRFSGETFVEIKASEKVKVRFSYDWWRDKKPVVPYADFFYNVKTGLFYTIN